jgi:hypothetical protein
VEFYSNQGNGSAGVQGLGAGGAVSITGEAGLALAVAVATHGWKGLHSSVTDPGS